LRIAGGVSPVLKKKGGTSSKPTPNMALGAGEGVLEEKIGDWTLGKAKRGGGNKPLSSGSWLRLILGEMVYTRGKGGKDFKKAEQTGVTPYSEKGKKKKKRNDRGK